MSLRYDAAFYVQVLDKYVATGECAEADNEPLYAYLLSVMNDPMIKIQVLSDELCARIFYDAMSQFIRLNLEKQKYNMQKSQSEQQGMELVLEWSETKRKDGWQALLQEVADKHEGNGFDKAFYQGQFGNEGKYADEEVWERMVDDWKDEFYQAWGLMSGMWNTVDFERIRKIVRIQKEYPEVVKVANKMGRMADDEGQEQLHVAQGNVYKMEHSSKSDILGITVGNDLNALLPTELAHCADDELEDLFVYKYVTRKLQTFRYKSEIMQPARRLEIKPATQKGPMIVCLDTSGSMVGKPEKIAYSLLIKILEIADRQRRDCFLIAFSVSINPIDVRRERARLLEFFSTTSCGDTDATRMLQAIFRLLQSKKEYMNADVLWISDFKIPLSVPELTDKMLEYRKVDTHFYGLQLGIAENEWSPFFDRIYRIDYTPSRRY